MKPIFQLDFGSDFVSSKRIQASASQTRFGLLLLREYYFRFSSLYDALSPVFRSETQCILDPDEIMLKLPAITSAWFLPFKGASFSVNVIVGDLKYSILFKNIEQFCV